MQSMNGATHLEHRASSRLSKHEGESSFALCDRLDRTRANSQRQLPTDHDYAVPTREYQTDQSSLKSAQTAARPVLEKQPKQRQQQLRSAELTRSLHIRAMRSLTAKRTYCRQYGHFELSEKIADSSPHKNRVPGGGKKQGQSFRIWPLEEERISGTVLLAQTVTGTFGAHSRRSRTMHVTPPSTRKKKITCIGAVYPPVVCFNQPESSGLTIPAMLVETF